MFWKNEWDNGNSHQAGRRVHTRDRLLSPRDRSENNKKLFSLYSETKKMLFSLYSENNQKSYFHCTVKIMNAVILNVQWK